MSQQIRNFPRKLLSELAKTIRAIKDLRGKPDGFVGTGSNGYAETDQLGSGTASAGTVLLGNNTWGAAGGAIAAGDYNDIEVVSATDWRVEAWAGRKIVTTTAELEAAVAAAVSGDVIYLAAGTYTLTAGSTLTVSVPNVVLCGAGPRATIVRQTDYNTDILSIRHYKVTIENMTIHHGTTYESNGAGSAGYGRGIVIEQPTSVLDNITDVTIRNVHLFNTANWAIFDTGVYSYDVLATPIGTAPTYGYDSAVATTYSISCTTNGTTTLTSVLAFGNVRVGQIITGNGIPHNTRVVAKASSSSLTMSRAATDSTTTNRTFSHTTECAVSVGLTIESCTIGFWNSGGCIYVGYGSTTTKISGLKNNGYSFGTYSTHAGGATDSLTMGQIHIYGGTNVVFDRICIFQSPSDGGILPDTDATLVSIQQTNKVNFYGPYIEVLSENCADSNSGAGGREFWFFTSMNCQGIVMHAPSIISKVTNPAVTDEGYPLRIWKTSSDDALGTELHWKGGVALQRRLYYNGTTRVAAAPSETNDFVVPLDRDDFVFQAPFDGEHERPIHIEDFEVVNYVGNKHRPPTTPSAGGGSTITSRTCFRLENNRLHRMGVWDDNDLSLTTSSADDMRARTALAMTFRPGLYGHSRGLGRQAFSGSMTSATNLQAATAGAFVNLAVGMRVEGNLLAANTYVSAKPDNTNVTLSAASSWVGPGPEGPYTYTFYANGTYQREGLWGVSGLDNDWRQIPWIRKHTSAFPSVYAGDLWMELGGSPTLSVYPNSKFHWYHNGVWLTVVGISRGTTAAGDLIYYTAADTPARLAAGTTGYLLTQAAGPAAPAWAAPDFSDSLFRISDNGTSSKKVAFEVSAVTAATTRTWTAPDKDLTFDYGTYTPTLTSVANVDSTAAYVCQYMRVGSVVNVSGHFDVDQTTASTLTQVGISLPIASNLGTLDGTATGQAGQAAVIQADTANDRAQFAWNSNTDTGSQTFCFVFQYVVA